MIKYGVISTAGALFVMFRSEDTERFLSVLLTYLEAAARVL